MVTIDGTDISGATIDGTDVSEITMDGDVVWTATPELQWYDEMDGEFTDLLDEHGEVWVAEYKRTFTDSGSGGEGFIEFYLESETVFKETYSPTSSFHTDVGEWVDDFDHDSPSGAQTDEILFLAGV